MLVFNTCKRRMQQSQILFYPASKFMCVCVYVCVYVPVHAEKGLVLPSISNSLSYTCTALFNNANT